MIKAVWKKPKIEYIGDIAIIKPPFNYKNEDELKKLANEILEKNKYIKSVWLASSPVEGEFKTREYKHLAGEYRSETIYKEHGCSFKVDIRKVFITPRLSYEHLRIANLVKNGEIITNMFAGAGLFSIIIAKKSKPKLVHSIDINPYAYKYMVNNIDINKVNDIVIPYLGDSKEIIEEKLINSSDRVLMPLPEKALEYIKYAISAINKKGFIHIYLHINSKKDEDYLNLAENISKEELNKYNITYKIINSKEVRPVGPRLYQVVLDVYIEKN
ncbi:putative methyltransferase [Caldisphaera lagunensis DSM 15908]|uniref:Putative methyltransferase n=1 Tax=Caldisphaera lagunensis (strain DSM 15908 / JCM 11604 / ANMR 0165 / IC-154) TaxID=1056495 RepID=L0A8Q3_CALLD|nr:class I SAM-dependent methyltransferase family protein [Caldisphaera lagunensis]AFZ70253.1 putative methyltransferase [Caldisphaera lagunensis DSM 15908]